MQRYFVDFSNSDKFIKITGADFHHIKNVMRMKVTDPFFVINRDKVFYVSIVEINTDSITCELLYEVKESTELKINVVIAQGMPKGDKFDYIIQKTTELGVSEIIPVLSERSLIKVDEKTSAKKVERFEKIAKEAAEQSHRSKVPTIKEFMSFNQFLEYATSFKYKLVAYEASVINTTFKNTLKTIKETESLLVFIGPEGGISDKEYQTLIKNGFEVISLGKRILRTETAPLFVMSAIAYELELGG